MTLSYITSDGPQTGREIYSLEWDDENESHLADHRISTQEVRQILSNRHLTMPNPRAKCRITLVGVTNGGRVLALALDPTGVPGTWRPVTGMTATARARGLFDRYCR